MNNSFPDVNCIECNCKLYKNKGVFCHKNLFYCNKCKYLIIENIKFITCDFKEKLLTKDLENIDSMKGINEDLLGPLA